MHREPSSTLEERIARLEARAEIRELVAHYCFTVDGRDVDGIGRCFTRDGVMRSLDGVMNAVGRDAVIEQFHGRFAVLGPSNHFTHDHLIEFDPDDPDRATGLVNTHAEVVRNGEALIASLRYHDEYRREDGRWRFGVRTLSFFYYVKPADYAAVLTGTRRNLAYAEPRAADFPESLETWQRYHREHPRSR
ncbi:MAG: nuclear transport factor 2 family protein [Gammaproteobacteria bacterium]|nr:nuclear transport factor 2 family protein [Gammaproteobacteria bacterium]